MKTARAMDHQATGGAVLYCWTDVPGAEGERQLDDQERRCREHCARSLVEVVARFLDPARPGRKADRPGLIRAIEFVVRNRSRIGRVVVARFAGLARSAAELDLIAAILGQQGVVLESVSGQVEIARDDSLSAPLEAYLGACEYERLSALTKQGILAARRSGFPTFAVPVGYLSRRTPEGDREIVPDPETAPLVSEAFRLASSGEMTRAEMVRCLRQMGARLSPRASRLTWKALRRILSNRMYLGLVPVSADEGWIRGRFEPLTDPARFEAAQARLSSGI